MVSVTKERRPEWLPSVPRAWLSVSGDPHLLSQEEEETGPPGGDGRVLLWAEG